MSKTTMDKLTPEQDEAQEYALDFYLNEGESDEEADKLAYRDLLQEFPELAKAKLEC